MTIKITRNDIMRSSVRYSRIQMASRENFVLKEIRWLEEHPSIELSEELKQSLIWNMAKDVVDGIDPDFCTCHADEALFGAEHEGESLIDDLVDHIENCYYRSSPVQYADPLEQFCPGSLSAAEIVVWSQNPRESIQGVRFRWNDYELFIDKLREEASYLSSRRVYFRTIHHPDFVRVWKSKYPKTWAELEESPILQAAEQWFNLNWMIRRQPSGPYTDRGGDIQNPPEPVEDDTWPRECHHLHWYDATHPEEAP